MSRFAPDLSGLRPPRAQTDVSLNPSSFRQLYAAASGDLSLVEMKQRHRSWSEQLHRESDEGPFALVWCETWQTSFVGE